MHETAGERIKKIRKAYGYKQKEFAEELGFSNVQTLSNVETNVKATSHAIIMKLVEEFGVSMQYIISGKGVMIWDEDLAAKKMKFKNGNPSVKPRSTAYKAIKALQKEMNERIEAILREMEEEN